MGAVVDDRRDGLFSGRVGGGLGAAEQDVGVFGRACDGESEARGYRHTRVVEHDRHGQRDLEVTRDA